MIQLAIAMAILLKPSAIDSAERTLLVRLDRPDRLLGLAKAVEPIGRVESRKKGTDLYWVRLNSDRENERARKRLSEVRGVHVLSPEEEPFDITSVNSLSRKIALLESFEDRRHDHDEQAQLDYLRAYRYFVAQRAFPNDKVDWSGLAKGRTHASQMPSTRLRSNGAGVRSEEVQSWTFIGPNNLQVPYQQYYGAPPVSGRVNAVAFDPNNSQTIYAGSAEGGLFKSTDGGATWNWLSAAWTELAVNCIAIDPTNSDTIYVGRGDYHGYIAGSYGIMKSTDGGATWTEIAEAAMGSVGVPKILMDPTNSQVLIAGTGDTNTYGSLYRSTNGGQTWTKLALGGNNFEWPALAASTPNASKVRFYAVAAGIANSNGAASRVYKSDDHGVTWQLLSSPIKTNGVFHYAYCVAASPTNANNVYVLDSENQTLVTSVNQGASWSNVSANLPNGNENSADYNFSQDYYDYHLECGNRISGSSNIDVLYLGEIDITESLDAGNSWTSIGGPSYAAGGAVTHNDQHCLAVCPTNPNFAVFGNDGGVYSLSYSASTGQNTVTPLNKQLGVSMFYKIAPHPTQADYLLGGTQDNASPLSVGDLSNWLDVGGGDGGGSAINQVKPLTQYATIEDLVVYRTEDGWNSFSDISPSVNGTENLPFVAEVVLDPSNQSLMYTGTNFLYRWNDDNDPNGWANRLGNQDLTNKTAGVEPTIQAIAIAPTDSSRIYTGSSDGALWMSTTQGDTWKELSAGSSGLPLQAVTSISVSPTNSSDILVGLSGTSIGKGHLYRCVNTQAASVTFASVSGSGVGALPDVSLNAIARDLDNPATTWWIAMDAGVFQTTNSGATWTNAGASLGLPNVIVDDLVAVPGTRYLNAGTYGRGIWRLYLTPPAQSTLGSLSLSVSSTRRGGTVSGVVTLTGAAPTGGAIVNLLSSNTSLATVPASVTVAAGATSAPFSISTSSLVTSPGQTVITAAFNGVAESQTLTVTVPTLSGRIVFGDYLGQAPTSALLNFRLAGAAAPFMTMTVSLDSVGNFTAQNVPAEAYSLYVQSGTWLRKTLTVDLTTNDVTNALFELVNGDINGDNRIDTSDLRLLVSAMGSKSGAKNWNSKADLNGDGVVDSSDLAILYKNYGKLGNQ